VAQANILRTNFNLLVLQGSLRAIVIAQNLWNVAMSLNPIGAVITAVALLVAGFMYLYNNSETVREAINDLWQSLVRMWDYCKILYQQIASIDFVEPFKNVVTSFEKMQNSIQNLGKEMLLFLENMTTNSESIYTKISRYFGTIGTDIYNKWNNVSKTVGDALSEVGKGWIKYGQMYVAFGRQLMQTDFVETINKALEEVGKGWVKYGQMYVSAYNDIKNYDYATLLTGWKTSIENMFLVAFQKIKQYTQVYKDFANNILNSTFSENISKAITEVGKGFVAYAKLFTDFGKDISNKYQAIKTSIENIFDDLVDSLQKFLQTHFGTELASMYQAWQGFRVAIDKVKTSFEELKISIVDTFNAVSDNAIGRTMEKFASILATSKALLAEKVAKDTGTAIATGDILRNPVAKQKEQNRQMDIFSPFFEGRPKAEKPNSQSTPSKTKTPEDLALEAENKKRAEELAKQDAAEQAKKDAAAKERLAKKNEERKKATEQALKDLQNMELQLMQEGQEKELLQMQYKYEEMYAKVAEAHQKGLVNDAVATSQLDAIDKLKQADKEKILEKYRQLGIEKANAEQDAIVATKKQLQDKELAAVEANKANKDAKAGLENLTKKNDLVDSFLQTDNPDEKIAIQEQIVLADNLFKQNLLDNELWLAEQKLAIHSKYGTLTEEQETALLNKQAEIEAQKTQNTIAEAERRKQASQAEFKATLTAASGLVGALGNLQNALGQDGESWVDFKNALTLAQIGIDTASAISSLTAASSANPSNAVTFGAAGAIQFATGVVSIMANIAKATSILAGTNKPKATPSKAATASNTSSGGTSGYVVGGYTGDGDNYEVAGVVHKNEYVIPAHLLKVPQIANFAGIIEAVRTNKQGYMQGGLVDNNNLQKINTTSSNTNPSTDITQNLLTIVQNLANQVQNLKEQPLMVKAHVVARDISEVQDNEKMLNDEIRI
jgi:hypothetical protein